jgi:hypothetical protein
MSHARAASCLLIRPEQTWKVSENHVQERVKEGKLAMARQRGVMLLRCHLAHLLDASLARER